MIVETPKAFQRPRPAHPILAVLVALASDRMALDGATGQMELDRLS